MVSTIAVDLLIGVGQFLIHPLVYISVVIMFLIGYRRVKRERYDFHTRVYDVVDDIIQPLLPGVLVGLVLSAVTLALGLVVPFEWIVLVALIHIGISLTCQVRWLSPAYTIGTSLIILMLLPFIHTDQATISQWVIALEEVSLIHVGILLGVLLLAEGVLIWKYGAKQTSPRLVLSRRGRYIGAHDAKRLWLVPCLLLVPGGAIPFLSWWPMIPIGGAESTVSLMFVPFLVGFQQWVSATLPQEMMNFVGKRVFALGLVICAFAAVAMYVPVFVPLLVVAAICGREALWVFHRIRADEKTSMFSEREQGIVILGVIPGTTAEKMKLKVGEVITKVNGIPVKTDLEFYEGLQKNSAFCKLEVKDHAGEIRYAQAALYEGGHHQIGVLFVKEDYPLQDSVV
ncbi:PDZ domain-containing protein [Desertibacillus haloalkaliphilus]|uniref:PDZ domain-containing protein n=1 Tax=Desertibacillus haloalkaliphilus TaxID=1328930 RepID=UPI001C25CA4C|nr:PDZ domain-containing protein [Desertibacillus haloalkaliphilus]MBU8908686.1 PDZ domain-containing protein [Desertibacillus haloalkaliphilus]